MKIFEGDRPISELINNTMDKLKVLMDSGTIIGEKITTSSGATIIPISKVSVGYVVGGGEYNEKSHGKIANRPMAGGSGGGMSVTPVGFLCEFEGNVNFIDVEQKDAYQTILNLVNSIIDKFKSKTEKSEEEKGDEI